MLSGMHCQDKKDQGKVVFPKVPISIKVLHLFLKKEELFVGIKSSLHLFVRCLMKTHAETIAESMGNLVDMHWEKRRDLGIEDVGKESLID